MHLDNQYFDETVPFFRALSIINQNGFTTYSSQPGHDEKNHNCKDHTHIYGYGYIAGYVNKHNKNIIKNLINLSDEYVVIIQNKIYHKNRYKEYEAIPMLPIGNNKGLNLDEIIDLWNVNDCFNHTFSDDIYHIIISTKNHGYSNIIFDVYKAIV